MVRRGRLRSFRVDQQSLARLRILAVLPKRVREGLAATARGLIYPKGEQIDWEPDERGDLVFGVVDGSVRISFRSLEGKEMPVSVRQGGDMFELGDGGWAGVDETVAAAQAGGASVCSLPYRLFEDSIVAHPNAVRFLLAEDRTLVRQLGGLTSDRLHGPADRVRHTLWRDTQAAPDHSVFYTHELLARKAGTDQPRTTREMGRLQREGVIEVDREQHRIIVLDPERLASDK